MINRFFRKGVQMETPKKEDIVKKMTRAEARGIYIKCLIEDYLSETEPDVVSWDFTSPHPTPWGKIDVRVQMTDGRKYMRTIDIASLTRGLMAPEDVKAEIKNHTDRVVQILTQVLLRIDEGASSVKVDVTELNKEEVTLLKKKLLSEEGLGSKVYKDKDTKQTIMRVMK